MNKNIILWLAALLITLLAGYLRNVTSPEFPVSGTIGIDAQKVTYYFDKVSRDSSNYKIIIRSDLDSLSGYVVYREKKLHALADTLIMTNESEFLTAEIPFPGIASSIVYEVFLQRGNDIYQVPKGRILEITFWGKIPLSIKVLFFLTFFVGILLSTRTGLEYFNPTPHTKKLTLFTLMTFSLYSIFTAPVYRTFELNLVGNPSADLFQLFTIQATAFFVIWLTGGIIIFRSKKPATWGLVVSVLTLIISVMLH